MMSFQIPDDYQLSATSGTQNISLPANSGSSGNYDFSATPSVTTRIPFGPSASQGFFQSTTGGGPSGSGIPGPHGRYDDLKLMLESNKDGLKLEAMRRIIAMVAKGRSGDAPRELFAHVVKSVVTQNVELKKLVYLYLSRYAEQEQELALLSVSSFQRSLKDPNPLIRASALRVLGSIRVSMVAPIMLVSIRESANDMSPYVRKTAAHAIPKLYNMDPEMKDEIVDIIERLLHDRTSLVLASAVYAFEQVCPERTDLVHQNYRKFCALIADFDEWGQVIVLNLLLRYARTQFTDPNKRDNSDTSEPQDRENAPTNIVDPDLRLLIRSVRPLLASRNSSVAMSVIQLYLHLAPRADIGLPLVKPLIRLLHSHREIQLVVLANIVSLTSNYNGGEIRNVPPKEPSVAGENGQQLVQLNGTSGLESETNEVATANEVTNNGEEKKDEDLGDEDEFYTVSSHRYESDQREGAFLRSLFEPHLKSFFIKSRDSTQVKIFKLHVLTNLANSSNIPLILREFQAYIQNFHDSDVDFVSAVIHAIGVCAARITEVSHICLNGLISLLSNRNQAIVANSIVVIRSQIVKHVATVGLIIKQITRLFDSIATPQARATIIWILAEFCDKNNRAFNNAPDVLRKVAKSFSREDDLVKLQALNLAAKLYVTLDFKYGTISNGVPNSSETSSQKESPEDNQESETPAADSIRSKKPVINEEKMRALVNYIFNLAKYDLNYDVRDRGRFLRALIARPIARRILLSNNTRAYSEMESGETSLGPLNSLGGFQQFMPSGNFRMGTLSHFLGRSLSGYESLPPFPLEAPDRSVRDKPEPVVTEQKPKSSIDSRDGGNWTKARSLNFYSDEETEDSEESSDEDETSSEEESGKSGEENSDNEEESSDDGSDEDEKSGSETDESDEDE